MKVNEYLKNMRDRNYITIEHVSSIIGVPIETIESWEKDTLPENKYIDKIISAYKLDEEDFLEIYEDDLDELEEDEEYHEEWEKYFTDEEFEKIVKLSLTDQEQEFLGMEYLYKKTENLPYKYVEKVGAFKIASLKTSVDNKLGKFKDTVIQIIIEHDGHRFNVHNLERKDYLKLKEIL